MNYLNSTIFQNEEEPPDNNQTEYWRTIQGHHNPYDKEFYDYVMSHDYINFGNDEKLAQEQMRMLHSKLEREPMFADVRNLPCEKSTGRLALELIADWIENWL